MATVIAAALRATWQSIPPLSIALVIDPSPLSHSCSPGRAGHVHLRTCNFVHSFRRGRRKYSPCYFPPLAVSTSVEGRDVEQATEQEAVLDVSSNCVQPVFRSAPILERETDDDSGVEGAGKLQSPVHVLFLSEGNICRSVLAQAKFTQLLQEQGLADVIMCSSKATRDYNVGEEPDSRVVELLSEEGLSVAEEQKAQVWQAAMDIVEFDILITMDKFTLADVLKEVSVFDTINPGANLSAKVRRLGDFSTTRKIEDIDDPLYGNLGSEEEMESLRAVWADVSDSCEGLLQQLMCMMAPTGASGSSSRNLRREVRRWLRGMEAPDWLVPPMLQRQK